MRPFLSAVAALLSILVLACGRSHVTGAPTFALAVAPGQLRLLPGLDQAVTLTLQPEPGFSGVVELSAGELGPGLLAQITPTRLTLADGASAQATLVLTAAEEAPAGTRRIGLRAAAPDSEQSAELVVDIPVAAFFTVMTYRSSDPSNFAYLVYQDGDGAWTAVRGTGGLYRLPVTDPAGRFGVLLGDVCRSDSASTWITNGFFSTLGEVQLLQALVLCNPQPGPPPLTFDLSGAFAGATGRSVLIGANSGLWSFPVGTTEYALKLLKGSGDLVAATYPDTRTYLPARFILERGRDTQSSTTRDFDFAGQGADAPPALAIQRPDLSPGESFQGTVQYQTSRGQVAILGYGQDLAAYAPVPPALTLPGDAWVYAFYALGANQSRMIQGSGNEPPGSLAPHLPPAIPPYDLTTTGGRAPRLSLAWSAVTPAPNVHEVVLLQQVLNRQSYCYLYFGKSWHGGAPRLSWTLPDLTAVPGFLPEFFPQSGTTVQVSLYQSGTQTGQAPPGFAMGTALEAPFRLVTPAGAPGFPGDRSEAPGMRLRPQGTATPAATAPWIEYWAASRTQTLVP